ncbi:MAG: hypothetical protein CSA42_08490 [Gammaproteobacteria bacterium]|nr:MAG: hypothetical protein CSA42_08490 [Gammaproteobacteria bacterium]
MNLFEFDLKDYFSSEKIYMELKSYFNNTIDFLPQDDYWDIIDKETNRKIVGLDILYRDMNDEYAVYVQGIANFSEINIMQSFYKYFAVKYNTMVLFNGFTEQTCQMLFQYNKNVLYEAYSYTNEKGIDCVVPYKIINEIN